MKSVWKYHNYIDIWMVRFYDRRDDWENRFVNGEELIHELSYEMKYSDHSYSDDMEITFMNGENCKNGFTVRSTCARCGEEFSYNIYEHYEIVENRINLSPYGGCEEHCIVSRRCPCGYEQRVEVEGMSIMDTPIYVPMPEGGFVGGVVEGVVGGGISSGNVTLNPSVGIIIGGNNVTYSCDKCGVQVKKSTTEGERNENCEYTVYETYEIIAED